MRLSILLAIALLTAPLSLRAQPQAILLSEPGSSTASPVLGPDSGTVLFLSNPDNPQIFRLYAVAVSGGENPVLLSENVNTTTSLVSSFRLSPDGRRAAYLRRDLLTGDVALLTVPVDASTTPVRVDPGFGDTADDFRFTADSEQVLFRAQSTVGGRNLYRVPADGSSAPTEISGDAFAAAFTVTPNGQRAVFSDSGTRVYSVPVGGGEVATVDGRTNLFPGVSDFAVSPDSQRAVYKARTLTESNTALYSAPVDGSDEPVRLGPAASNNQSVNRFRIGPGSARVVFETQVRDPLTGISSPGSLRSAPLEGGIAATLEGSRIAFDPPFAISPDGGRVIYARRGLNASAPVEAVSVPIAGGTAVVLGGGVNPRSFHFSPSGTQVLIEFSDALVALPTAGGSAVAIADLDSGGLTDGLEFLGSITQPELLFAATVPSVSGTQRLYRTSLANPNPLQIAARTFTNQRRIRAFAVTADDLRAVLQVKNPNDTADPLALYALPLDPSVPIPVIATGWFLRAP
ncbi:MAG: hypothetical protein RLY93_13160 [Sumerlaeia bacterium]